MISLFLIGSFTISSLVEIGFERFNPLHMFLQLWDFVFSNTSLISKLFLIDKSLSLWSWFPESGIIVFIRPLPLIKMCFAVTSLVITWMLKGLIKFHGIILNSSSLLLHELPFNKPLHFSFLSCIFLFSSLIKFYA